MSNKLKETVLKILFVSVLIGGVNTSATLVSASSSTDATSIESPSKSSPWEEREEWWEEIWPF